MTNGRVVEAHAPEALDPDAADVLDLSNAGLVLVCTDCDHETVPCRREGDPETVVRCATCGKKHSTENLRA